ncbi:hypothetical protein CspeluHIS016_0307240 [Cutaneotrichosporon spelunceum]|uniref:Pali-domain-containing protein n=1 Tax=Cutaneotrichosporon spelunceum TaxID=1672016 RepID=A0AAD3TUQ5_9TREE|nr:hypothetical protein CspeluHIS016_0307240 [Cutaneotrichosporon spelunceum]
MARWNRKTSITGRLQTTLLFLCFVLTLLPSLGPPLVRVFALRTFSTPDGTVWSGALGYCTSTACSRASVGYDLAAQLSIPTTSGPSSASAQDINAATRLFLTLPLASGTAFLGIIVSGTGQHVGTAIAAALFGVAFSILSIIAVAVSWATLRAAASSSSYSSSSGVGAYLLLAACVLSGFCWVLGVVECCLARQDKKRRDVEYASVGSKAGVTGLAYTQAHAPFIVHAAPVGHH